MKVAFILRTFPVLSETFILEQIVGLIDKGVDVDIYSLFQGERLESHPLVKTYRLIEKTKFPSISCSQNILYRYVKSFQLLPEIRHISLRKRIQCLNVVKYQRQALLLHLLYFSSHLYGQSYDIIHCHFGMYGLVGLYLRELELIHGKLVTSFHGMDIHVYPKQNGKAVYQNLFLKGDLFTTNSDFSKQCLVDLGCPQNKISKLPVGLRSSSYYSISNQQKKETTQILTIARLIEKKGIEYSIKAVATVYKKHPKINYVIVGAGELYVSLDKLIRKLNAERYINLVGPKNQTEIRKLYATSDIFLLSSVTSSNGDMEGQGLVLQEAQASSLPVVSTWHNGIPEGILVDKSGILVPERDVDAITEALIDLIDNPYKRHQMGVEGRKYVQHKFNIDRLNNKLIDLYSEML